MLEIIRSGGSAEKRKKQPVSVAVSSSQRAHWNLAIFTIMFKNIMIYSKI